MTSNDRNAPPLTMSTAEEIRAAVDHLNVLREDAEGVVHNYCMTAYQMALNLEEGFCKESGIEAWQKRRDGVAHAARVQLIADLLKASLNEYDPLTIEV